MGKTYEGEVATEPQSKETTTGKVVWWFAVRASREGMVDCQAWENSCKGDFSKLKLTKPITVTGYWKEQTYQDVMQRTKVGNSDQLFVLNAFYFADEPVVATTIREQIVREYGSIDAYKKARREYMEQMKALGLVPVNNKGHTDYRPIESCIKIGNRYVPKIEFCMDVLGAEVVTKEITQAFGGISFVDLALGKKGFAKTYSEKLEKLCERAQYQLQYEKDIRG